MRVSAQIVDQIAEIYGVTITIAMSDRKSDIYGLSALYKETMSILDYRYQYGGDKVIDSNLIWPNLLPENQTYPQALEQRLMDSIREDNFESAESNLSEMIGIFAI
jgi:hypothetical protein